MPIYEDPNIEPLTPGISATLRSELDERFEALDTAVSGLHDDTAEVQNAVGIVGRVVGEDLTADAPEAGTGLTLRLVNGAKYIINGALYEVDDPDGFVVISGLPSNKTAGVYGYLSIDPDTGAFEVVADNWYDELPEEVPAGLPCLGLVTTDADSVTDIDDEFADKVQTHAAILARIAALEANGGGEGGGGGETYNDAPLRALIASLAARIVALENASDTNVVGISTESEMLAAEMARVLATITHHLPVLAAKVRSSIDLPGLTGNGELWPNDQEAPVVYGGGNAIRDEESHTIHG